jgi:hypothetical protein
VTTGFYCTDCIVKFSKHLSGLGPGQHPDVSYVRQCLSDLDEDNEYPAVTSDATIDTDREMAVIEPGLTPEDPHVSSLTRSTAGDNHAYH